MPYNLVLESEFEGVFKSRSRFPTRSLDDCLGCPVWARKAPANDVCLSEVPSLGRSGQLQCIGAAVQSGRASCPKQTGPIRRRLSLRSIRKAGRRPRATSLTAQVFPERCSGRRVQHEHPIISGRIRRGGDCSDHPEPCRMENRSGFERKWIFVSLMRR